MLHIFHVFLSFYSDGVRQTERRDDRAEGPMAGHHMGVPSPTQGDPHRTRGPASQHTALRVLPREISFSFSLKHWLLKHIVVALIIVHRSR